jgi:D-alanyl-D-alanine carboxypeptidase (penicillin-binding protein 5/6)
MRAVTIAFALLVAALAQTSSANAADDVVRTISDRRIVVVKPRPPRGVQAKTAIVLDGETGLRLWGLRPERRRLIASTTKIMTALVAVSRTRPNQMLTATDYRAGLGESLLGLRPGERMSAQDLIKGLLLVSGNDAADTLAAGTASSRAAFVVAMNRRARALGLTRTHFANPVGLDSPKNYSTASDLAQLARAALRVPRVADVTDKEHLTLRSGVTRRRLKNHNPLIGRYRWAVGVKTGHTLAAGYLLVGAAEKGGNKVISVVTGEPTEAAREADSAALLRFGRAHYRALRPLRRAHPVTTLPVALQDRSVRVYPRGDVALAVRDGERVVLRLVAPKEIEGPRSAGSVVGRAVVLRGDRQVASVPVVLGAAVPAPPVSAVMLHALGRMLPWVLFALALALLGTVLLRRGRVRTRRPGYVG